MQDDSEQSKSLNRAFEKLRISFIYLGCRACTGMVAGVRARGVRGFTWKKNLCSLIWVRTLSIKIWIAIEEFQREEITLKDLCIRTVTETLSNMKSRLGVVSGHSNSISVELCCCHRCYKLYRVEQDLVNDYRYINLFTNLLIYFYLFPKIDLRQDWPQVAWYLISVREKQ